MQQDNLDNFIIENGEKINESIRILSDTEVDKKLDDNFHPLYGDDTPIPGKNVVNKINGIESINKETALDSLIAKSALIKAKNEAQIEKKKLTKKTREEKKKQFIESMMYQQEEEYYQKHHYVMDGKTKRSVRKRIERDFDKGRYDRYLIDNHKSLNG